MLMLDLKSRECLHQMLNSLSQKHREKGDDILDHLLMKAEKQGAENIIAHLKLRNGLLHKLRRIRKEQSEERKRLADLSEEEKEASINPRETLCIRDRLGVLSKEESSLLDNMFMAWPSFSGDIKHPIPAPYPYEHLTPEEMFQQTKFKWYHIYGHSRLELLNFCIDYLQYRNL